MLSRLGPYDPGMTATASFQPVQGEPKRFPIGSRADVQNAIRAVGRVRPNTDAARAQVRRYIMAQASKLGCSDEIPDSWKPDGSLELAGHASESQVLALAGDDEAREVFIELAGHWKHGWIPVDDIARAIRAKQLSKGGDGLWHHDPSVHGKSRINAEANVAHALAPKGKARPPRAVGDHSGLKPHEAVRMKAAELGPHAGRGDRVAKAELERRAAKREYEQSQPHRRALATQTTAHEKMAANAAHVDEQKSGADTVARESELAHEHHVAMTPTAELRSHVDTHGRGDVRGAAAERELDRRRSEQVQREYATRRAGSAKARDEAIKAKHPVGSDVTVHEPGARRGDKPVEYGGKVVGSKAGHVAVMPNEGHGVDSKHARAVNPEHVIPVNPDKVTLKGNESYNLTTGQRVEPTDRNFAGLGHAAQAPNSPAAQGARFAVKPVEGGHHVIDTHNDGAPLATRRDVGKPAVYKSLAQASRSANEHNTEHSRMTRTREDGSSMGGGKGAVVTGVGGRKMTSAAPHDEKAAGGFAGRQAAIREAEASGHVGNASMGDLAKRRTDSQLHHIAVSSHGKPEGAAALGELASRYSTRSTAELQAELSKPGLLSTVRQLIETILTRRKASK